MSKLGKNQNHELGKNSILEIGKKSIPETGKSSGSEIGKNPNFEIRRNPTIEISPKVEVPELDPQFRTNGILGKNQNPDLGKNSIPEIGKNSIPETRKSSGPEIGKNSISVIRKNPTFEKLPQVEAPKLGPQIGSVIQIRSESIIEGKNPKSENTVQLVNMSSHGWVILDQLLYNHLEKIPVGATKSSMKYLGDQVFEQKKIWSGVNQHKLAKSVKGGVFDRK